MAQQLAAMEVRAVEQAVMVQALLVELETLL
jgi:hypothetical protein